MLISFFVQGVPKGQARPRVFNKGGKIFAYSPKTSWYEIVYTQALKNKPKTPIVGPIMMEMKFFFPRPKSKKKDKWKTSRPDFDNLEKSVCDALTHAGFWKDDSQVVDAHTIKQYEIHGRHGVDILVCELLK